jgi:polyisoprenoid-binding protein YceI
MITAQLPAVSSGTWQVDPIHSSVEFLVTETKSSFRVIAGRFTDFEGTLTTGPTDGGWRAQGVIQSSSLTTAQDQRDAHLRSPDLLNVAAFPEIRFESERMEFMDGNRLRVVGRVVLQGQAQPLTLQGTILGYGKNEDGAERVVLSGTGELAFGPMAVQLTVHLSAVKSV